MHMCSPRCGDLFSSRRGVRVACGAELWPREVCVCLQLIRAQILHRMLSSMKLCIHVAFVS